MRLDWLDEAARATGYPVVIVDGWTSRGVSDGYDPSVVVAHHTAGPSGGGDMPSLGICVNGRSDLPGPLANYCLGRSGTIYVVASGKANNAGEGSWTVDGVRYDSNYDTVGIEAENDGHQPWPDAQLDSYARLVAEIIVYLDRDERYACGHKEWAPSRKVDPHTINMSRGREVVGEIIEGEDMPTADEIRAIVRQELDRRLDGKAGPVNGFYGIGGAVATIGVGSTNPDTGEAPPMNIGSYLQKTYTKTKGIDSQLDTVEKKVDDLDTGGGTGGVTEGEVDEKIATHAANADAHHE